MDLISRKDAIDALGEEPLRWNNTITEGQEWNDWKYHVNAIKSVPTVPAVPLDKLCEWLEKNACYYQTEDNGGSTRFSLDACQWKIVLAKWMEEQDATD